MKLRKYLNELKMAKDKRSELRDKIINPLNPGTIKLDKALKRGDDPVVLSRRDAKILFEGIKKVLAFLDKIGIEK